MDPGAGAFPIRYALYPRVADFTRFLYPNWSSDEMDSLPASDDSDADSELLDPSITTGLCARCAGRKALGLECPCPCRRPFHQPHLDDHLLCICFCACEASAAAPSLPC